MALWIAGCAFFAALFAAEAVRLRHDLAELDAMIDKLDAPRSDREAP